jgi:hypothetical protein
MKKMFLPHRKHTYGAAHPVAGRALLYFYFLILQEEFFLLN